MCHYTHNKHFPPIICQIIIIRSFLTLQSLSLHSQRLTLKTPVLCQLITALNKLIKQPQNPINKTRGYFLDENVWFACGVEKNYNILLAFIIFPFLRMHRSEPLSLEQIAQLRTEVNKLLQANMDSFASRTRAVPQILARDFDALYMFAQGQHSHTQKTLQSLAQFTYSVLSNGDLIWQEVHHRQGKLLQLRESLSAATIFLQELRGENDEMRSRLQEAETYIQWVEEEKEYLDAIYCDRSQITATSTDRPMLRCVSERTLLWHDDPKRKSPNYEKLKGYIDGLKQERSDLERELMILAGKYEAKCEDVRKANALIEHLVDRLNQKIDRKDYFQALSSSQARESRTDLSEELMRLLERAQHQTANSRQNTSLFEQEPFLPPKPAFHYFDSFTQLPQTTKWEKQTKNVGIGTESFGRRAAACQTQWHEQHQDTKLQEKIDKNKQGKGDLRISICVGGEGVQQQQVVKIISELHIDRQIEARLKGEKSEGKTAESSKIGTINKTLLSTYEYYRNHLVTSRIKKYRFSKPDPAPVSIRARKE